MHLEMPRYPRGRPGALTRRTCVVCASGDSKRRVGIPVFSALRGLLSEPRMTWERDDELSAEFGSLEPSPRLGGEIADWTEADLSPTADMCFLSFSTTP
jgi:hypothetical protein